MLFYPFTMFTNDNTLYLILVFVKDSVLREVRAWAQKAQESTGDAEILSHDFTISGA